MLNDDDRVAAVYQFLQYIHQDTNIFEVKARGRLVKNIECLACVTFRQLCSQLDSLTLTA